jgi:hypothetical protein
VFLREGCAGYITPCRVLVVVPITSFLPSVKGLELLLFNGGTMALLQSQWGALDLYAVWGVGLLVAAGQWIATPWRSLDTSS